MGDIFNLETPAFLIVHCGALLFGIAALVILYQAYIGIKKERAVALLIKSELNRIKSDLLQAKNTKKQIDTALEVFEEESSKVQDLRKELEEYKQKLEEEEKANNEKTVNITNFFNKNN